MPEPDVYQPEQRHWQDRFDTRRLADRLAQLTASEVITPESAAFIGARDFFFLASVDADGMPTCSFKGGAPGFVRVVDETTLAFPSYDGNGMFLSMGNVLARPPVGLLFVDFEKPNRIRVQGHASVSDDDPLLEHEPEAQLMVRIAVTKVFPNCPRYVPKMQRVADSPHVPRPGVETPFAPWKRLELFTDALPEADAERARDLGPLSLEAYLDATS
jgi:uncharacterized protein